MSDRGTPLDFEYVRSVVEDAWGIENAAEEAWSDGAMRCAIAEVDRTVERAEEAERQRDLAYSVLRKLRAWRDILDPDRLSADELALVERIAGSTTPVTGADQ